MRYNLSKAMFSGTPNQKGWGQVHDFAPLEPEKLIQRGRIIAVLSSTFETTNQLENINIGREILARLHEEYFGELEAPAFEALKNAVTNVANEFSTSLNKPQIGAFAVFDNKIIFSGVNGITAYVLRNGVLAKVVDPDSEQNSGAGNIQAQDTFVMGTKEFFFGIPQGSIKASMEKLTANLVIESLTPFIYENKKETAVGTALKFSDYQEDTTQLEEVYNPPQVTNQISLPSAPLTGVKKNVVNLIDRLLSFIPDRKIVIHSEMGDLEGKKNKRTAIAVGLILLVLLLISIGFGVKQRNLKVSRSRYEDRLVEAQHQLDEAKTLQTLNQSRARELLLSSRNTLNGIKSEGVKDERVDSLLSEINSNIGLIAGIYEVSLDTYLDLSLLSSGFKGDDVSSSEGRMLVLDRQGKLASITLDSKKTRILAGPSDIGNAKYAAAYIDRNFVLTDNEVLEVTGGTTKTVIQKDWDEANGIKIFGSNAYILDKSKSVIWRYAGSDSGFGSQKNWFAPGINVNLSGIKSWAIDGSIWLLTGSGEIERYTNGSPQNFVTSGLEGDLSGASDIFTDDSTTYLYVLDKENGRVIVLEKTGAYKAEYLSDQIKDTTKLVVSEDQRKIILLSGDKLYSIDIAHL